MPPDTNLFTGVYKRLPPPHRACSYIQTQQRETGKVGVVRERGRTADDRVIKAELHLPDRARRRATVRPSRLLLMAWASKNWPLLSRLSLRCAGDVKYQVAYNFSICSVLHRLTGAVHCRTWPYGGDRRTRRLTSTSMGAECVNLRRRMQCERGLRTTNNSGTSTQMNVLEMVITVLHRLPNERRVGRHV